MRGLYSPKKTLSAFSLSPLVQVLETLVRSFIKLIHWALNTFSIELNRKLVQSSVNRFYCCVVKELLFSKRFINNLIDSSVQLISQQPGCAKQVADRRLVLQMQDLSFLGSSISAWTTILKTRAIFVHQTLTEHAFLHIIQIQIYRISLKICVCKATKNIGRPKSAYLQQEKCSTLVPMMYPPV